MDAARDLVGSGRIEGHVFGRVTGVHGEAVACKRQRAIRCSIACAVRADTDGMWPTDARRVGEMHGLSCFDRHIGSAKVSRGHAYLVGDRGALATCGKP